MAIFKNRKFVRDYECTTIVAVVADSLPAQKIFSEMVDCNHRGSRHCWVEQCGRYLMWEYGTRLRKSKALESPRVPTRTS